MQNQKWVLYSGIAQCRVRSTGSSADCKVWQQQEGRTCNASPSHTWGVISLPSAVTVTCKGRDSCTSSNDSLSIILLSPTTWTGSRGYPRTELAFLMSLSSLLLSAAEMLLLHTAEKMADAPTESLKEVRSAPCTQKDTSFLSRWSLGLRG